MTDWSACDSLPVDHGVGGATAGGGSCWEPGDQARPDRLAWIPVSECLARHPHRALAPVGLPATKEGSCSYGWGSTLPAGRPTRPASPTTAASSSGRDGGSAPARRSWNDSGRCCPTRPSWSGGWGSWNPAATLG